MPRLPNLDEYDSNPTDDDPADKPKFKKDEYGIPYADEEAEDE